MCKGTYKLGYLFATTLGTFCVLIYRSNQYFKVAVTVIAHIFKNWHF